jgi:histidinol-phosphate aminotransferase
MSLIDNITPKNILELVPYQSAKRELFNTEVASQSLWLNANESPFQFGKEGENDSNLNRYPDFQSDALIDGYAAYAGVNSNQVLATRGADEGIELLVRTFCTPGQDSIVINPPTYGMYKICATTFNVATISIPTLSTALTDEFQLDVKTVTAQQANSVKLVFICSPNNPTGGLIARQNVIEVLEAYKNSALVVLDEAYIEFSSDATVTDLLDQYPNLVVLRTLSKAFALAGIRCGFTIAQPEVIDMLKKVIAPYPIPAPVEAIALQALNTKGLAKMRQQVQQINQQKVDFVEQLQGFDFIKRIQASDTNFVLLQVDDKQTVLDAMQKQDIYIRDQSSQPGLTNNIRITIGSNDQMSAVVSVLKEIALKGQK